ncbi:MFS general substrate transporter [Polychaeton citri CBS 116435]|uniref:MFS general substrate transporter n=1 Tax=Polychaeton citri CBS 116435 TaxID=1314669 RepID=A0A9P4UQN1_9PEZI|nr:MFS general substrate transporter [Polychaeton citri CBS 116435]
MANTPDQASNRNGNETLETTPLILKKDSLRDSQEPRESIFKPIYRILLCGLLTSLSFGVTQVPLIYVFRVMTCEAYYDVHDSPPPGLHDRCAIPAVESGTAKAVSLLGVSTTFFGVANLFITRWGIKRFGVKSALALQVFWPAARLAVQNVGVAIGGTNGIIIVQCSQIITIIGGPNGYLLALNTYVTEVTEHKERTAALGRLQGCFMFGSAIGFLVGGVLADVFDIITPFQVTLVLFLISTIYVLIFLPYFPPHAEGSVKKPKATGIARLVGPLRSIMPAKWVRKDGAVGTEYGAIILAAGVFLAVLATGYIPTLLQMYATDIFDFGTRRNSYLVSMHSFLRGLFLTFVFPQIISTGRHWMERKETDRAHAHLASYAKSSGTSTPSDQQQLVRAMQDEEEPDVPPPKLNDDCETFEFDLIYTRFSLLADGVLTLGASFVSQGWQMYLVGALLPFGAGTASAAKGTILQMCPASEKTDALSAIAFVEMMARLSTTFVFGLVFAAFAGISKTYLVFVCNAAVALFGFVILLFSRFPPQGSTRLEAKTIDDDDEDS